MEEFLRVMPNYIARSCLFSPVVRGRKKIHTGSVLVSRGDAEIKFWGEQLEEAKADVWMQVIYEVTGMPQGEPVAATRASFLEAGRDTGKSQYESLHRTMQALSLKQAGKHKLAIGLVRTLHSVDGFDFDHRTENCGRNLDARDFFVVDRRLQPKSVRVLGVD